MNELQKCELEILIEVDRICKKNNISYSLDGGTLLGAIRHKGFIPWDDDVDIMMPLKDYNKFLEVCKSELGSDYFLQTAFNDFGGSLYAKIRKNNTTAMEDWTKNIKMHKGVWIDIFPTVGYKGEKYLQKCLASAAVADWLLGDCYYKDNFSSPNFKIRLLSKFLSKIPLSFRRFIAKKVTKKIFVDSKGCEYSYNVWTASAKLGAKFRFDSSIQGEYTTAKFEGYDFSITKKYDEYLKTLYGDYMQLPPEDKRTSGHNIIVLDLENNYTKYENN